MKWLESDFMVNGEKFSMFGLELFYSRETVANVLAGLAPAARAALDNHLHFDFAFMAGIFPGISAMCMMAREKTNSSRLRKALYFFSSIQLLAWACDIRENLYLMNWMNGADMGNEFRFYHFIVAAKWIIALTGFLLAVCCLLILAKRKNKPN